MFSDMVLFHNPEELEGSGKKLGIGSFIIAKEFRGIEEAREIKSLPTCFLSRKAGEKAIQKFHNKTDFIAVVGGSVSVNKFAASNRLVDFLVAPCTPEKASIDTAIIKAAKENNVSIVVPFNQIFSSPVFQQSQLLRHYLLTARLCKRFRVKCLVFSLAKNASELKSKKELIGMGMDIGFSEQQLEEWNGGLQ